MMCPVTCNDVNILHRPIILWQIPETNLFLRNHYITDESLYIYSNPLSHLFNYIILSRYDRLYTILLFHVKLQFLNEKYINHGKLMKFLTMHDNSCYS